jgi:hypothetical protein
LIRRPISPILSPSSRTFVELTLVTGRRARGDACWDGSGNLIGRDIDAGDQCVFHVRVLG